MTLPVPLGVRLKTVNGNKRVTAELRGLTFRSGVPGGFASAAMSLDRPLSIQPDEIAYYGNVYVDDLRTGRVIWEGRLEDPGRGVGADGQIWELSATGPAAHARDRKVPYIGIDQSWERWRRADFSAASPAVKNEDSKRSPAVPSFTISATSGAHFDIGEFIAARRYEAILDAGQQLGRVECLVDNGATATQFANQLITRIGTGGSPNVVEDLNWNTVSALLAGAVGAGTPIPAGDDVVELRAARDDGTAWDASSAGVPVNTRWAEFWFPVVRARLKNADGTDISSGYSATSVLASEIVKDLLGRLLDQYDGANATVTTTSYAIEQLVYPDGVTPAEIFDDLMLFEPTFYWRAGVSNSAGKYEFDWVQWPTAVRYEASVADGYSSTGSGVELFNKVTVVGADAEGLKRKVTRTQTVPDLGSITREELMPLADELYTTNNATQIGDQFLAEHLTAPNAGTLTVARTIYDHLAGREVAPWEIQPGYLIRVNGIRPNVNALNATARDGVTVFKIMAAEFDASSATASLELDSRPRTVEHLLARLQQKIARRG